MPDSQWKVMVELLKDKGIRFTEGLTSAEISQIQDKFRFVFPDDLRDFLQTALPVSDHFPNWRTESDETLQARLDTPLHGLLFDLEHNDIWMPSWGPRPTDKDAACDVVRGLVQSAPSLIPVYSHRMMPDRPQASGNPVYSVHQTDIIYYGINLRDYLIHEFLIDTDIAFWPIPDSIRQIEFWDIMEMQSVRWDDDGQGIVFDNRDGTLP